MGNDAKADAYLASVLSRFDSSALASNKVLRRLIDSAALRARLVGATAPAVKGVEFLDMPEIIIADLKGKVAMLDFLAHWCLQCIADFPYTKMLQEKYGPKGLVVIGLTEFYGYFGGQENIGRDIELVELKRFKAQHKLNFGFMVVPRENTEAYGVSGLPAVALIDRTGRIRYLRQGADYKRNVEQVIERLIDEQEHE